MNVNELRIGNAVMLPYGDWVIIEGIEANNLNYGGDTVTLSNEQGRFKQHIDSLKPIPLTEKHIFQISRVEKEFMEGRRCYTVEWDDRQWIHLYEANGMFYIQHEGGTNPSIEFLHEWQNLYFALTGKELETPIEP
jgi:hypothetical protein